MHLACCLGVALHHAAYLDGHASRGDKLKAQVRWHKADSCEAQLHSARSGGLLHARSSVDCNAAKETRGRSLSEVAIMPLGGQQSQTTEALEVLSSSRTEPALILCAHLFPYPW